MKVLSNLFGNNSKINSSEIVVKDFDNKPKSLDKLDYTIEETTNGFIIKFANGFMYQEKKVKFSKSFSSGSNSVFYIENDMGDWDKPFIKILNSYYKLGTIYGARQLWLGSNQYQKYATATSAGTVLSFLNFAGEATYDIIACAWGTWK